MKRKNTCLLYALLLISLFALNFNVSARKTIDSVYYYMKIDTAGIDVGYFRIDSTYGEKLVIDHAKGDYALWKFVEFPASLYPNQFWIVNYKTRDTMKFHAPVAHEDTAAFISANGNLFRWEDLFLDVIADIDTLVASYTDASLHAHSFFLTLNSMGEVMLLDKYSNKYQHIRFRLERATLKPDETKYYRLKVDTSGMPVTAPQGYLATVPANGDSLRVDTARNDFSAWRFTADSTVRDTTYYGITNKHSGKQLSFGVPQNDTVATLSASGSLKSWMIPFFVEDREVEKFTVRDAVSKQMYYLGMKDSLVMLARHPSAVKFLTFALEDEISVVPPPVVGSRLDSTEIYKVKITSGVRKGKYLATSPLLQNIYIDSVYAHIPDGQFVVNKLNTKSLINRNMTATVTDTFHNITDTLTGLIIPDLFVYRGDTVEAKPVRYGSLDKRDSLLGYKFIPDSTLKTRCFYFQYTSADSLNGRMLNAVLQTREVLLAATGDTSKYFVEYVRTEYGTPAPAGIAALKRRIYHIRTEKDTTYCFNSTSPLSLTTTPGYEGVYMFKETEIRNGYSFIISYGTSPFQYKYLADTLKRLNFAFHDTLRSSSFLIAPVEIPVYPDDEYQYLRYLPSGRGLYEIRSTVGAEEKKLTKNFYNYSVFSKDGESVLKAGSYVPSDFHIWVDTARGPGSNRFRTSVYLVREAADTTGVNVQGYYLHVTDSATMVANADKYVAVNGKKYGRGDFVRAKRLDSGRLQLLDNGLVAGEGTPANIQAINEYRFYLQKTDADTGKYYIVTEKGYGGRRDSTGYLSYSFIEDKYYFGPREGVEGTMKLTVRLQKSNGTVANEVISRPSVPEDIAKKEITITGEAGCVTVRNASGNHIRIYNIVGQVIADIVSASDIEKIAVPRGIAIVKAGQSVIKKVIVN